MTCHPARRSPTTSVPSACLLACLAALGACSPGGRIRPRHTHSGEYGTETSDSALTIRDDWGRSEGWVVSTALETGTPGTRVSALLTSLAPGPLPPFEAQGTSGGVGVTEWIPFTSVFEESESHVVIAELGVAVDGARIRVRESDIEAIVDLRWSVVDPSVPDEGGTDTHGVRREALREDLRALGIVPREDWGAAATSCSTTDGGRSHISIHHTEGAASDPARQLRSIQSYHRSRGWCDIGYHFLIDASGTIYEGRPVELLGAHVGGHNTGNLGISFIGCYSDEDCTSVTPLREEALEQAGRLVGTLSSLFEITPSSATVSGHRDQTSTTCPGNRLYPRIGDIIDIARVSSLGGGGPGAPSPDPAPDPSSGGGTACTHSWGGVYADRGCSASYQCCGGDWRSRGSCGACTCVEPTGSSGCSASGGGGGGGGEPGAGGAFATLSRSGSEIPRAGLANGTLERTLGHATEPYGSVVSDTDGSWVRGTISWFGGPSDTGVSSTETGAITGERLRSLNSPEEPSASTLASRPEDYYFVAMRWNYSPNGQSFWRDARIAVRSPSTGATVIVRPVDWGPNTSTRRIVDVSPQTMVDLGVSTDATVLVAFAPPGTPLGPYGGGASPSPDPGPSDPAPDEPAPPRAIPLECDYCETFSGSLATGAEAIEPGGSYFEAGSGTHEAWLHGPAGTDFDLRLLRWDGAEWTEVQSSAGASSEEQITYAGAAGYYAWVVLAYAGSGAYTLELYRP